MVRQIDVVLVYECRRRVFVTIAITSRYKDHTHTRLMGPRHRGLIEPAICRNTRMLA